MPYKLIKEFKNTVSNDPVLTVRGAISPLFLIVTWQEEKNPLHIFSINKGRDTVIALNDKNYVAIATDKFRDYFHGSISLQELKDEYSTWEKDVFQTYDEFITHDVSDLTNDKLRDYVCKINDHFLELARRTIYIENVDYEKILSVVGEANRKRLDAIWEKATHATFISFEGRRLKKMLDIIESNTGNSIREAKFIFTDYFWIKSDGEISTVLNDIRVNAIEKMREVEKMIGSAETKKIEHNKWLQTLDDQSKKIAEFIQLVMHMRDVRKDPLAQMQAILAELSQEMLKRAGVNMKFAPHLLLYEYMKGVDHLTSIKSSIENRENGCIYIVNPDMSYEIEICDFENAVKEFEEIVEEKTDHVTELKGQIACLGKVVGVVRVVLDPYNDKGFKQGDILVTSMTRPEFVPIMKKAGAVVTNEGGVTCHAAIVSRELNIPCIIGTKVATRVLKDGDMVEVDADKGIVRKL